MPTELTVRPAEATDMAQVADLYLATRRAAVPSMPPPVHDEAAIRGYLAGLPAHKQVWVAEGERLVGFAVFSEGWLDSLYVDPQRQGHGVGATMLDLVKTRLADGFCLWVFVSNRRARAFYRRHGLVELEQTDGSGNEERAPDVRMAWLGADPTAFLRREIDDVDDDLADLLERRSRLTEVAQRHKRDTAQPGRDRAREAEIVTAMAARAPRLGPDRMARIMAAVIDESLDAMSQR